MRLRNIKGSKEFKFFPVNFAFSEDQNVLIRNMRIPAVYFAYYLLLFSGGVNFEFFAPN